MKSALFIFAVSISISAISCRKEKIAPPAFESVPAAPTIWFSGKVDGVLKSSDTIYGSSSIGFAGGIFYNFHGYGTGHRWEAIIFPEAGPAQNMPIPGNLSIGYGTGNKFFMCHDGSWNFIAHDSVNHIITLSFEGVFDNPDDEETVEITEGKLRMSYE